MLTRPQRRAFHVAPAALLTALGIRGTLSSVATCDATFLADVGCPAAEQGVDWVAFLASACEKCTPDYPCDLDQSRPPLSLATEIVDAGDSGKAVYSCELGYLSAVILVAQFYLVRSLPHLVEAFARSPSLAPFPFSGSQYSMFVNMVPAHFTLCDEGSARLMRNVFVPRVHHEDSGVCGMVFTDQQLVRRCRARRRGLTTSGRRTAPGAWRLNEIECPKAPGDAVDEALLPKVEKYFMRAEQQCQTHKGMWREEMSDVHKCVLVTVGHFMGFKPGDLVLDWGSGCGHKLTWAKALFDVDGLGLDLMGAAVSWAQKYSAGKFCNADGRDLQWIPDGVFDHIISYAAIYHLSKLDQCTTGIQLVRKLKLGGRAFFGWNHATVMDSAEWFSCFQEASGMPGEVQVDFEAIEDAFFFPPKAELLEDNKSFLFHKPAYSIFLTRVA